MSNSSLTDERGKTVRDEIDLANEIEYLKGEIKFLGDMADTYLVEMYHYERVLDDHKSTLHKLAETRYALFELQKRRAKTRLDELMLL